MVSLINGPLMLALTKRCLASVSPPQLRVSLDDFSVLAKVKSEDKSDTSSRRLHEHAEHSEGSGPKS